MSPKEFIQAFLPMASIVEKNTGLLAVSQLAQAADESAWGNAAPGFNFFGVKAKSASNRQLEETIEYCRENNHQFPVIISITPCLMHGHKYFKYVVKDWFAKYSTPIESFQAHADFLKAASIYRSAWSSRENYLSFNAALAKAGYATDPGYEQKLNSLCQSIESIIKQSNHFAGI